MDAAALERDAVQFARRAVRSDHEGRYSEAVFYYKVGPGRGDSGGPGAAGGPGGQREDPGRRGRASWGCATRLRYVSGEQQNRVLKGSDRIRWFPWVVFVCLFLQAPVLLFMLISKQSWCLNLLPERYL